MTELLYATSHLAGTFTSPDNANGNTPGTWAGQLNTNVSQTSRWAIGDPADPLTTAATQTIRVVARKGSNTNDPQVALNLYESGVLVQSLVGNTTITSQVGQDVSGTFNTAAISDRIAVEVEVVMTAAGGSGTARNSAQISLIEWTADVTAASNDRTGTVAATAADDSLAAAGMSDPPSFTGTASVTEQADPLVAAGAVDLPSFTGTLSVAESADGITAAGTFTPTGVTGSLSATESADTLTASGPVSSPSVSGTIAVTEAADVLAASGAVTSDAIAGSVSVTEAVDALVAAGAFTPGPIAGTLAVTGSSDTLAAAGVVVSGQVTGTLTVTEAADTLVSAGSFATMSAVTGTLAVTEQSDTLAAGLPTEAWGATSTLLMVRVPTVSVVKAHMPTSGSVP